MQSLTRGTAMRKTTHTLIAIPLALAGALTTGSAYAHVIPTPCEFITGGGWVIDNQGPTQEDAKVNFGAHGGCKNGAFWGHINIVHHGWNPPAHVRSTRITGYVMDPNIPNARDICGEAQVDGGAGSFSTRFRVRLVDNGEPGGLDRFGLRLETSGFIITTRELGPPGETGGGGNIKLHKPNPSTTPPSPAPSEDDM